MILREQSAAAYVPWFATSLHFKSCQRVCTLACSAVLQVFCPEAPERAWTESAETRTMRERPARVLGEAEEEEEEEDGGGGDLLACLGRPAPVLRPWQPTSQDVAAALGGPGSCSTCTGGPARHCDCVSLGVPRSCCQDLPLD